MRCPFCEHEGTKVIDKREGEGDSNRRRRECEKCGRRFTTYEKVEGLITKVKKRDGRIVDFQPEKITEAIWKAAQSVGGTDRELAQKLSEQVVEILEQKFAGITIPHVEQVQDIVEKVLVENGHYKTAKAYILYRKQHEKIRKTKQTYLDVINTIGDYISEKDWRVKENSNEAFSFSGLMLYISGKTIANYVLNEMYEDAISQAHIQGYMHIHDLSHGLVGYCSGWSLKNLIMMGFGGVPGKVDARPAKHLNSLTNQMVNFLGCLQMEFAGAQAFSSIDTYLAPFVAKDKLTYEQVKQEIQSLIYHLNIPSRWGCFSEDTEILTKDGWKLGKDLKEGETIVTFNTKNEEIEYLPVLKMTKYPYKGKMVRIKNRITDQLVTPNHRVLRRVHNYQEDVSKSKYVFEEAVKLKTKLPLIPLGGNFNTGNVIDNDTVKTLAWIISEGSLCRNERICIYQSQENPENCSDIRNSLSGIGIPFSEDLHVSGFTGKNNNIRFSLNRTMSNSMYKNYFPDFVKNIPDELRNLSTKQARTFIDTYMRADGFPPENKIFTKPKENADILQEIIAKAGWGSTCRKDKNGIHIIRVIKHDYTYANSIENVDYDGIVWCPTTTNGTVVVRRRGKVFISGNSQYPFTNITFDWLVPEDMKEQKVIVGGEEQKETYGDFQDEMDMINKAFLEIVYKGDNLGRIFTFPIPTFNLYKNFDWNTDNANLLFDVTAKYGIPYFQNYIGSDLDPKNIRAMCCRLNLNLAELRNRGNGLFGAGEQTGSIGVVTLNMNRLAYESKSEEEFLEKVKHYMTLARNSLEVKREVIEKNIKAGLMPYAKRYLGNFSTYFSTIGLVGMNEACLNLLGKNIATKEGKKLAIDTLMFMREVLKQFQQETGHLYNLEATPAESAAYRLAKLDKEMHSDIITAGTKIPYLTNSTHLPVNYTDDPIEAMEHQNDIQPLYSGGTVFHTFLGERMTDGAACKLFLKRIANNTKLPYVSITPTFSICPVHGYVKGEHFKCPMNVKQVA